MIRTGESRSESTADTFHKGDHVLVDGQLVSSKYEHENGKSKTAKAANSVVFWSVRANSVRRLSRAEAGNPTTTGAQEAPLEEAPYEHRFCKGPPAPAGGPFYVVLNHGQIR
jgi:single-stranded DNA-binding protein